MFRILIALLFLSFNLKAQLTQLLGPTATASSYFGEAVAINDTYAVVGQPATDGLAGPVFEKIQIFKRANGNWDLHQTISTTGNHFDETYLGGRLGITDRWLAATLDVGNSWQIRMYEIVADSFIFRQTLSVPEPWNGNFICKTVAVSNEHLIAGGKDGRLFFFRFENNQWERIQVVNDNVISFGSCAAIYGNRVIVGSQLDNDAGTAQGAAVIFEFDGNQWQQVQKLYAADAQINHSLGSNVAIADGVIAVSDFAGVYTSDDDISAVYLYKQRSDGVWFQFQKLTSPAPKARSNFGLAMVFSDKYLFVGANEDERVYKYERTDSTYNLIRTYGGGNVFGESLAISGNTLMIGDPWYGNIRGAVYFAQVVEELYPVVNCMLPSEILGNQITPEQIGEAFISNNPALPGDFGILPIEQFFAPDDLGNRPFKVLCFNHDSITEQEIDFIKLNLPDNPDLEVQWKWSFEKGGVTYTAEDILDDVNKLKPKLINIIETPMDFTVHFGAPGAPSCVDYNVTVSAAKFQCTEDTIQVDINAGETIQLNPPCTFETPLTHLNYGWSNTHRDSISDVWAFAPLVNPTDTTFYRFRVSTTDCASKIVFQVNPLLFDNDDDGFNHLEDCDDENPGIFPGALEIVDNGIDENCDGVDEGFCHIHKPDRTIGKDIMIRETGGGNYKNSPSINLSSYASPNPPDGTLNKRILMDFKLPTIPQEAIIDSAILTLHFNPEDEVENSDQNWGRDRNIVIQRVIEPWSVSDVAWFNQPSATDENEVFVPADISNGSAFRGIADVNVTDLIKTMYNTGEKHGFLIRFADESISGLQMLFAASEHPDAALHPELFVCWHRDSTDTSLDNIASQNSLIITPNPAREFIDIINSGATVDAGIYSLTGKRQNLIKLKPGTQRIGIQSYLPGVYFLRTSRGEVFKFIKQ